MLDRITKSLLISLLLYTATPFANTEELTVRVSDDNEVLVERFSASGKYLIIWLVPEYGFRESHRSLAKSLAEHNIEIWLSDIIDSLFLPRGSMAIKNLSGKYIADIMEYAHKITGKKVIVMGDAYGSLAALKGAHQWQHRKHKSSYFIGAILFSPYTFASIPALGKLPEYMPVISSTNIPIMIYQAKNSGIISQFNSLIEKLQQHNNPVYTRFIPDVMSLFYKLDPTKSVIEQTKRLPINIKKMIGLLESHGLPLNPIPLKSKVIFNSGIDVSLKPFNIQKSPISLNLEDVHGKSYIKNHYENQVTIINFWATWCPPCVEEIPSLNRLQSKMKDLPFELLSVNYAEKKSDILKFMQEVNIEFPVLLDQDGQYAKQWNVISYPSTFIIGPKGKIEYGANAAIEWDSPEVIDKIKSLF